MSGVGGVPSLSRIHASPTRAASDAVLRREANSANVSHRSKSSNNVYSSCGSSSVGGHQDPAEQQSASVSASASASESDEGSIDLEDVAVTVAVDINAVHTDEDDGGKHDSDRQDGVDTFAARAFQAKVRAQAAQQMAAAAAKHWLPSQSPIMESIPAAPSLKTTRLNGKNFDNSDNEMGAAAVRSELNLLDVESDSQLQRAERAANAAYMSLADALRCPICSELLQAPLTIVSQSLRQQRHRPANGETGEGGDASTSRSVRCGHTFCSLCIRRALKVRPDSCPVCRIPITASIDLVSIGPLAEAAACLSSFRTARVTAVIERQRSFSQQRRRYSEVAQNTNLATALDRRKGNKHTPSFDEDVSSGALVTMTQYARRSRIAQVKQSKKRKQERRDHSRLGNSAAISPPNCVTLDDSAALSPVHEADAGESGRPDNSVPPQQELPLAGGGAFSLHISTDEEMGPENGFFEEALFGELDGVCTCDAQSSSPDAPESSEDSVTTNLDLTEKILLNRKESKLQCSSSDGGSESEVFVEDPAPLKKVKREESFEVVEIARTKAREDQLNRVQKGKSFDILRQTGDKAECPVCGAHILSAVLNTHLDGCLINRRQAESRRTKSREAASRGDTRSKLVQAEEVMRHLPGYVYTPGILSDAALKRLLRERGLITRGTRAQLIARHKYFVDSYNSNVDALPRLKKTEKELVTEINLQEERILFAQDQPRARR